MKEFKVLQVSGASPYERGVCYGRQTTEAIEKCIANYKEKFLTGRGLSWDQVRKMAMDYVPKSKELMPDMLEEAQGIADGSGFDLADIMVLNCRYEILHYPHEGECTAFALLREATADGKVYIGQNWDQRPSLLEHSFVIHIVEEESGNHIVGTTEAGQLIRNGMNSYGIGLCSNSLHSCLDHEGGAVPSTFLRRKVLTLDNMKDVIDLARNTPRTVSNNFCFGSGKENQVADIEGVPGLPVKLSPDKGILTHANNLLVNEDMDTYKDEKFRGTRLFELLSEKRGEITLDYMQECLKDHYGFPEGICSHISEQNRTWQTNASIIYCVEDAKALICYGPPCEGYYVEYKL